MWELGLLPGCLRVVLGFLKKIGIFCFFEMSGTDTARKTAGGGDPQKHFIGRIFSSPSDF